MYFFFLPLFMLTSIHAHIFKIERYTKDNEPTMYAFSDCHQKSSIPENQINHQQREDLLALAQQLDACILVQDSADLYDNLFEKDVSMYEFDRETPPEESPMTAFISWCRKRTIPSYNIEWRPNFHSFFSDAISIEDFFAASHRMTDRIKHLKDNQIRESFYKKCLNEYKKTITEAKPFFDFFLTETRKSKTCAEIFASLTHAESQQLATIIINHWRSLIKYISHPFGKTHQNDAEDAMLEIEQETPNEWGEEIPEDWVIALPLLTLSLLNSHSVALVDANMVHMLGKIIDEKKHTTIFIMAHLNHIQNLTIALEQLGYTRTVIAGDDSMPPEEPRAVTIKDYFL